jgi:hypothetical protein
MNHLPKHIKDKIEQYMKHSHKANKLREEIDSWFMAKGIDTIDADGDYTHRDELEGGIIQDLLVDAAQGTATNEENVRQIIKMIERELL